MEHLAALNTSAIEGLSIAERTEKLSLYADDMLVYLADPTVYLESLLDTVDVFGLYSGLRLNWAKSVLHPVEDISESEILAKSNLMVVDQFTYLGIAIHKDVRQFEALKFVPYKAIFV